MTDDTQAALVQAAASIGHAVESLDSANVTGDIRDDAALLCERLARALTKADDDAE